MRAYNVDWDKLKTLAEKLAEPGLGPGSVLESEWQIIEQALDQLLAIENWEGLIHLREMFAFLVIGDTTGGLPVVQRINAEAINAAERLGDIALVARFLHDEGHNLHRQGYHERAIKAFERSAESYQKLGEEFRSLESYYMTALCHRALENRTVARRILDQVLQQVSDDPWRGNPLQVMAWLMQDEGHLDEAEELLREALTLYEQYQGLDSMLVVQTLADLGEVVGLQGRYSEALENFERSLTIASKFSGQFDRQEARTKLKLAEIVSRRGEYEHALRLLDEADDKIRGYGHYYDLLWRIELARAFIYWRQWRWGPAVRKLRMALRYRRQLGLSNVVLAKQLVSRLRMGAGLPR